MPNYHIMTSLQHEVLGQFANLPAAARESFIGLVSDTPIASIE